MKPSVIYLLLMLLALAAPVKGAAPVPPGDPAPVLRLEAGGPTAFVTSLVFSPDGKTLYTAGFDKVVRVWTLDDKATRFELDRASYRVPIGPGLGGAVNALALSPDGLWLAAAGNGVFRGAARFGEAGQWLPPGEMSEEMWLDQGMIYLFNTRTGEVRLLRGHRGPLLSLTFAPRGKGQGPELLSAGRERTPKGDGFGGAVRLWDVDRAAEISRTTGLPDPGAERPGLAVATVGDGPKQLTVGLAWNDGNFRLWDVAADKVWEVEDGPYNATVTYLPTQEQFVTGCRRRGTDKDPGYGLLTLWNFKPGEAPKATARLKLPNVNQSLFYPWALAACSSRGNGVLDRVAVGLRVIEGKAQEDRLRIIDPDPKQYRAEGESVPLWKSGGRTVLAASASGPYVAAAGNAEHEITLVPVADLLTGKANRLPSLRSEGRTFLSAGFVRRGDALGLHLSPSARSEAGEPTREPAPGDLFFDFSARNITDTAKNWKVAVPALNNWQAALETEKTEDGPVPVLVVRQGAKLAGRTLLKARHRVTDFALLPPGPFEAPLLAIASRDENFQPELSIYNGRTGERVRVCTGHQGSIRSVAFSPDGRLLVSAAEDQTVCVWSLAGFDEVLGSRGQLRGLQVEAVEGGVSILAVDRASPASGKIEAGSRLLGFVVGDKLRPLANPRAFYDFLFETRPGTPVTLRLRDPQGKVNDVTLTAEQGVDERKPLLSLFVTRPRDAAPEWVAWTPVGPYDASDRKTERLIGWHLNTGKPQEPVVFAPADEYRKKYYRPGLLKLLVERGRLAAALADWEAEARKNRPAPNLALLIDDPSPKKVNGAVLLQQPQATLRFMVNALDDFDDVEAMEWALDNGAFRAFPEGVAGELSAPLPLAAWVRGPHTLRARLRLKDGMTYARELAVHYQPAPASVTLAGPERRTVDADDFRLEGRVRPAADGPAAAVRILLHTGNKVRTLGEWETDRPRDLAEKIPLSTGENIVEVVAVNKDALAGHEELETERRTLIIVRPMKKAPEVRVETVVPLPEITGYAPSFRPGQTLTVQSSRVRVRGKIKAEGKLESATWSANDKAAQALTGFKANTAAEFSIDEEVRLEPGQTVLSFRAKTSGGGDSESTLAVAFLPPVPDLVITAPGDGASLLRDKDEPEVRLEARLSPVADRRPFTAKILINGKEAAEKPVMDAAATRLSTRIVLQPGENRIQVRLKNEWSEGTPAEVRVHYRRPPRVVALPAPVVGDNPVLDVAAELESPADLPVTTAQVLAEGPGAARRTFPAELVPPAAVGGTVWKLTARNVTLDVGANTLRVIAANADGETVERKAVTVVFKGKPPEKPRIEVLDPAQEEQTVGEPKVSIRLRVQSAAPLRSVQVLRGDNVVHKTNVGGAGKNAAGLVEWSESVTVPLDPGANLVKVVAVNDGGESARLVTVSYLDQPVRLVIDKVERKDRPNEFLVPERQANGRITFSEPAAEPRVWVHGRVVWSDRADPRLEDRAAEVRFWVNGFRQGVAQLQPRAGGVLERSFRGEILLSRVRGNRIEVELPDLKSKAGDRPEFTLDCLKPELRQRLHLLIVSVGEKDGDKVKGQVLSALQAQSVSGDEFSTPAFSSAKVYGPLVDDVSRQKMFTQLCLIRLNIEALTRRAPSNDVVLVYYKGGESAALDPFLWSSLEAPKRQPALTQTALEQYFGGTAGAHVVLLDVARDQPATAQGNPAGRLPSDARFGVLRVSWPDQEPPPARLLGSLNDAMRRGNKLKDVAAGIGKEMASLSARNKSLSYDQYLPQALEDLVLNRSE